MVKIFSTYFSAQVSWCPMGLLRPKPAWRKLEKRRQVGTEVTESRQMLVLLRVTPSLLSPLSSPPQPPPPQPLQGPDCYLNFYGPIPWVCCAGILLVGKGKKGQKLLGGWVITAASTSAEPPAQPCRKAGIDLRSPIRDNAEADMKVTFVPSYHSQQMPSLDSALNSEASMLGA